jgi:O-acetyl-ADP-ribose deacetylase (regulator of RNase III)
MLTYRNGDLLAAGEDIIVHGCNCMRTMGSGIAAQIREKCPTAYAADQRTIWGDKDKLGTFTCATDDLNGKLTIVVNAYTQWDYSRSRVCADYNAIEKVFELICQTFAHKVIALPKIGCGLAGGDWKIVSEILEKISDKYDREFRVYVWDNNEVR